MRNRIFLKRRRKVSKGKILLLTIITLLISSFLLITFLGNKIVPIFLSYSESELKRIITIVINKSVASEMTDNLKEDQLFTIVKDSEDNIQAIDFNPTIVNSILIKLTSKVQENLKKIENGNVKILEVYELYISDLNYQKYKKGVIFEIPTGIAFSSVLLNNIGPRIPVRINLIGNVTSNVNTKIEEYGINNSVLNVYVKITVEEQVILPLVTKAVKVNVEVPISVKIIQGKVPTYYSGSLNKNSGMYILPAE